jgi:OMF family outer membrane factor
MNRIFLSWPLLLILSSWILAGQANGAPASSPGPTYSLNDCLKIALEHNPQIRVASTQFLQAKGKVIQLHAILYPTVNMQALTTPLDIYVQFNQLLYTEATFPQLRLSRLTTDQAFINYRQTLTDVVFQIRQAFTNVLAARDRFELVQTFATDKVNAIKAAQQLFDAGQVQKSVVKNIQVQANLSTQDVANDKLAYTQAKIFLENLLGQTLPESAQFTGDYSTNLPDDLDAGALIDTALHDREDLKLLESQQLSAEQQIQIDMKNAYPIIGFSSNSTIQPPALAFASDFNSEANYNEPSTVVAAGQTQLPLSLYATWTIFDGGNLRGVKMSDKATIASRDVAIAQLRQSITGEVGGAVSRILTQQKNLKIMEGQPKPAELRHLSETAYQAGDLRELDKVNLENDILGQELLHLNSQYQLSLAAAALDHALGHGLKITQSAAPQPHP